jgi:hypothetical protein
MTQALACYQDVDDVLNLSYVPNRAKDIDVDDILELSYMPNHCFDTGPGTYDRDIRGSDS